MEFFEKAHVWKQSVSSNKDSKSKTNMKKQLKQMLYGYRYNDNKAIKESANKSVDLEDTFNEGTINNLNLDLSLLNSSQTSDSKSPSIENRNHKTMVAMPLTNNKYNDGSNSGMSFESDDQATTDSGDSSIDAIPFETRSKSEHFDGNRELATKNLKNLNQVQIPKKSKKRKLDNIEIIYLSQRENKLKEINEQNKKIFKAKKLKKSKNTDLCLETSLDTENNQTLFSENMPSCSKKSTDMDLIFKRKKLKKPEVFKDNVSDSIDEEEVQDLLLDQATNSLFCKEALSLKTDNEENESNSDTRETPGADKHSDNSSLDSRNVYSPSAPFVSYKASDSVYYKGFDDLLRNYKYPTMKNTPSEIPIFSTKSTQLFNCDNDNDDTQSKEDPFVEIIYDESLIDASSIDENVQFSPGSEVETEHIEQSVETSNIDKESSQADCSNNVRIYSIKNSYIFVIQHPAEIYIHGTVKVSPLGGTAEVLGYTLKSSCEIYAPYTNYAQCLRTNQCDNSYYGLFSKLTAAGLGIAETEDIVTTLGEYDVVVHLQPLKNHKLDFVENNFNVTNLFNKGNRTVKESLKEASEALGCSFYLKRPVNYFREVITWGPALKCGFNPQSRGIVCGGKGTGKSSFLRYYVNRLLGRGPVLVIDLDPGQCEFTVAGNVSAVVVNEPLLGPNFTHLKTPDMMLNVGIINVMDNLRRYATAVTELISYCYNNEQYRNMPWIVNTMGMCNTLGFKLLCLIILHLKPTFLLQLDTKTANKRFETYINPHTVKTKYYRELQNDRLFADVVYPENLEYAFYVSQQFITESTEKKNRFCIAPRDERYLNFLAYLGELMDKHAGIGFLGIIPYEVPLQCLKIGSNVKLDENTINKVINGKIIALCQQTAAHDNTDKLFTLDDKPLLCHGHGLIRGIDCENELLYIVTPSSLDKLVLVDTILYVDWVPELRGQEKNLPEGTIVPYRMPTLRQQKQLLFVPRRRFNILQFLKMSRNSI